MSPNRLHISAQVLDCDHDFQFGRTWQTLQTRAGMTVKAGTLSNTTRCQRCGVLQEDLNRYFSIVARDCRHEFFWRDTGLPLGNGRFRVGGKCALCKVPATGVRVVSATGESVVEDIVTVLGPTKYERRTPDVVEIDGPPAEVTEVAAMYLQKGAPDVVGLDVERECVAVSMETGIPTILRGHTGIGKTILIRRLHQDVAWPFHGITGHSQVEVDTLVGKIWVKGGEMMFQPGILPFCMKYGIALGINEINAIAPEVNIMLHELLDEGHVTITDLPPDHEYFMVRPHPNFRLYGTMNPPEHYPGTKELSPALARRCIVREVRPLSPDQEVEVIQGEVEDFDYDTARRMVQVATGMRKNLDESKCSFFLSTADLVMWARLAKRTGSIHKAAEMGVYGKAPREDVDLLKTVIEACIGGERRNGA